MNKSSKLLVKGSNFLNQRDSYLSSKSSPAIYSGDASRFELLKNNPPLSVYLGDVNSDYPDDIVPVTSLIDNYIYLYHLDTFIVIPSFVADSIQDSMTVDFSQQTLLSRSAPIFSYSHSGPRSMNMSFELHRDMMYQLNKDISNAPIGWGYDYVDYIVSNVQAMAVPTYDEASKMVNPPLIAVRLGSDIFIKGVVNGSVSVTYGYPIIQSRAGSEDRGRYGKVTLGFSVYEVDPYDAYQIAANGSFRGWDGKMESRFITVGDNF